MADTCISHFPNPARRVLPKKPKPNRVLNPYSSGSKSTAASSSSSRNPVARLTIANGGVSNQSHSRAQKRRKTGRESPVMESRYFSDQSSRGSAPNGIASGSHTQQHHSGNSRMKEGGNVKELTKHFEERSTVNHGPGMSGPSAYVRHSSRLALDLSF